MQSPEWATDPFAPGQPPAAEAPGAVEVLLPVPVGNARYTYRLPAGLAPHIQVGVRVLVPLGSKKLLAGVVVNVLKAAPGDATRLKPVQEVLDEVPVVTAPQLALFQWLAEYYLCSPGEVLKAALPTGLKLASELRIEPLDPSWSMRPLNDREYLLLEALHLQHSLSVQEAGDITGLADPRPLLNRLAQRELLALVPVVAGAWRPKTIRTLVLTDALGQSPELLAAVFEQLKRAPQQEAALLILAEAWHQGKVLTEKEVLDRIGAGGAVAKALVQKGCAESRLQPVARTSSEAFRSRDTDLVLTDAQAEAWAQIRQMWNWENSLPLPPPPLQGGESMPQTPLLAKEGMGEVQTPKPILLHGVTGSGKTLLYIQALRHVLTQGRQALYLLPEIGLTRQIIDQVKSAFGDAVGVYHSRISPAERVEIWQRVLTGQYQAVIGVRSAILLPFRDLGLIVVDEEHDASFKQQDPNPRYHARDVAVWYGASFGAHVLLGSATPSLESWHNAQQGRYHRVDLPEPARPGPRPRIQLVDLRLQQDAKLTHAQFSVDLMDALRDTIGRGEQAIVFKNRRGFSPLLHCDNCGHVPQCPNCDISLTFHKGPQLLRCHYCGYTDDLVTTCGVCGEPDLIPEGIGTERLEEQLQEQLPEARIARMDLDTTRGKDALANLIAKVEQRQVDILVGTQMVTKGLDFPGVSLATVVQADTLLAWPEFRAHEAAYQLLVQLAGRTGRMGGGGTVLIQTRNPEHRIFPLLDKPFATFAQEELALRQLHGYPPFGRLIRLELRHRDRALVQQAAIKLVAALQRQLPGQVLGPEFPYVARVRQLYRQQVLIKLPRTAQATSGRGTVQREVLTLRREAAYRSVQVLVDVDPR